MTYWERKQLGFGTLKERLGKETVKDFDACALGLTRAKVRFMTSHRSPPRASVATAAAAAVVVFVVTPRFSAPSPFLRRSLVQGKRKKEPLPILHLYVFRVRTTQR